MTRLGESVARLSRLLSEGDLAADGVVEELLTETHARRSLDLSDLDAKEQAALIAARAADVLPSVEALGAAIDTAGRPLRVKLGIDPTGTEERMGHHVVLIIGDITAKIGDPSGRSTERPPLTDEDIARNLATYRQQVAPFFDFSKAEFRHNSEWLAPLTLPELIEILARIPASMSLQREDFRGRLAHGHGLAMSELIYSVVMAIDSAKINADIELGGVDQLLNMQMGRKVMEIVGQPPQLVITNPLIEGTDGTGAKMSKSSNNYVPLTAAADEIFGKIMSIPDRLMVPYLKAWTEWTDPEIDIVAQRLDARTLHPMDLKKIVAGEATAALHGVEAAMAARRGFTAQFSARSFGDVATLPAVSLAAHGGEVVGAVLARELAFVPSVSAARRLARQNGLRVVVERDTGQHATVLGEDAVMRPLAEVVAHAVAEAELPAGVGTVYLKAGRKLARIDRD
jgi:tyrosyl-tRNA synthetase